MALAGQTPERQRQRLADGCCPVHGLVMGQIAGWDFDAAGNYADKGRSPYTVVACPRKDCRIAVVTGRDPSAEDRRVTEAQRAVIDAHERLDAYAMRVVCAADEVLRSLSRDEQRDVLALAWSYMRTVSPPPREAQ